MEPSNAEPRRLSPVRGAEIRNSSVRPFEIHSIPVGYSFFSDEPLILAHRGASAYAPDHTHTALRLALEQGAHAIEADVHLSRDGHPILHHNGDLSENTDGGGPIDRYTLAQLREFDAGYRYSPDGGRTYPYRGKGERLLTLADALEAFPDTRFNLDIKQRKAAEPTRRIIEEHGAADRVLVASFYSWRRGPALRRHPGPRSVSLDQMLPFMLLHWARLDAMWKPPVEAMQLPEFYHGLRVVTPRLIERAHRHGIRVHVWTVDDEGEMDRLLDWGVDGIVTNKPDVALRARSRYLADRKNPLDC